MKTNTVKIDIQPTPVLEDKQEKLLRLYTNHFSLSPGALKLAGYLLLSQSAIEGEYMPLRINALSREGMAAPATLRSHVSELEEAGVLSVKGTPYQKQVRVVV